MREKKEKKKKKKRIGREIKRRNEIENKNGT